MSNVEALKIMQRIQRTTLHIAQMLDLRDAMKEEPSVIDPKISALIVQFDAATDKIAARIQKLIDGGSFSAEDQAALQAEVDKLNLLGQDPANPVPPATA